MAGRDADLAEIRSAYAREMAAASGSGDPRIENAFATVPREDFVGPGPWMIMGLTAAVGGRSVATTLHRLLRVHPGRQAAIDRGVHLPHDLVVVDEASMVDLPLMAKLLAAVRPDAHLVLVGDPDQLTSVEVGSVLRDVVDSVRASRAAQRRRSLQWKRSSLRPAAPMVSLWLS